MAEDLIIKKGTREEQYLDLIPQIAALIEGEPDLIANLANICAALKQQFDWLWVGFYLVKEDELVLGPFQGPIACTRIKKGRGVCGIAWEQMKTIIVQDVNRFPGHIPAAVCPNQKSLFRFSVMMKCLVFSMWIIPIMPFR